MELPIMFDLYETLAQKGNPIAQYNLAVIYDKIKKDNGSAFVWLEKSAIQGYDKAQTALGMLYLMELTSFRDKAHEWFRKSAEQNDASGCYFLSYCYFYGIGVNKNTSKALKFFHKSTVNGRFDTNDCLKRNLYESLQLEYVFEVLDENFILTDTVAKQTKEIEQLKATIAELNITVPNEGGIEYQKAKKRFDEYKK